MESRRLGTALLEVVVSVGGYYVLRACGAGVFWSLTGPALAVAGLAGATTIRRRRLDSVGLLVLIELATTLTLTLVTQDPLIAALREAAYVLVAGLFCLVTLFRRAPLTHVFAASVASFGDSARERAFACAWASVPRYRRWQRALTALTGAILLAAAAVRAVILLSASEAGLAHAVDVSNTVTLCMLGALGVASGVLIQVPRRIIERLASAETAG
ncbi:VC0807 family protein [Amycolatopsis sp. VS8301801F10]|uniref:VC0807 family protein n=1 Tax=Amycolatopsis sp. VS8301801F10 TaxID=2652442 RepID=UPI0038FCFDE4